jgi:hypothetical protein
MDLMLCAAKVTRTKSEARAALAAKSNEELYEDILASDPDKVWDIEPEEADFADRMNDLRHTANYALDYVYGGARDVTMFCFDGEWWVFAGGSSWGDAPGEGFDLLLLLSETGVLSEDQGWSVPKVKWEELCK